MIFSSYEFIALFLPVVICIYYLLSKITTLKNQHIFLVFASLFFYAYFNINYLFIILVSIFVNYSIGTLIQKSSVKQKRKFLFTFGIIFNIGLLGYFKYYDFFIDNLNVIFKSDFTLKYLLLPLGISFFTFQQFSFLLSIYKNTEKIDGIIDYSLFVSFFPQLVAGPIVTYSEMIPQFKVYKKRYFNIENFTKAIYVFSLGLFKKIVIADTIAIFSNNGFAYEDNLGLLAAWATMLAYTLQIYFDFSGYSDMAIGLGKMFNIELPINFNSPYKSHSIKEFWNRWHITLGRALASYIYIPLGGNKKGKKRMYVNLLLTFLVSGLWHGAAWTFVFWGWLHGIGSVIERIFEKQISHISKYIQIFFTFLFVAFSWVLFRATSWANALNIYKGLFNIKDLNLKQLGILAQDGIVNIPGPADIILISGTIITCLWIVFRFPNVQQKEKHFEPSRLNAITITAIIIVSIIHLSRVSPFIYFNF
ncbi:MAG: MBOAT family O-acyltransferase [Clostridiales bacterium]